MPEPEKPEKEKPEKEKPEKEKASAAGDLHAARLGWS